MTAKAMTSLFRTSVFTAFFVVYIILSIDVMSVFFPGNDYAHNWGTHWEGDGDVIEQQPLAYRLLMPDLIRLARKLPTSEFKQRVQPYLITFRDNPLNRQWLEVQRWMGIHGGVIPPPLSDDRIVSTAVYALVVYASLLAFIGMLYALARALFPDSISYALLAPIIALLVIVPISSRFSFYYDYSSMFFTCACLYLLLKRHWKSYLICFLIGVYNHETALFMSIFYFMYFYKHLPRWHYIGLGVLQVVLGFGLEAIIRYVTVHDIFLYAMNYSTVWIDIQTHLPLWLRTVLVLRGHDWTDLMHTMILAILIGYHWMEKPEFLRAGSWVVLVNTGLFFTICSPEEYRDLYPSLPILVLMATHSLVRMSRVDTSQFFKARNLYEVK